MKIAIKRIYEAAAPEDGQRILVDRLWPRGVSKERAHLDSWLKEAAPSAELRKWFGHVPERWEGFQKRYRQELKERPETKTAIQELRKCAKKGKLTLLFGAKDEEHNQAAVLKEALEHHTA